MKNINKILITGITGSGGSYLAECLVDKGMEVLGTSRWHSTSAHKNLKNVKDKIKVLSCDLCDFSSIYKILRNNKPDAIFHLASLANVRDSFDNPLSVYNNNVNVTLNLLESVRTLKEESGYNPHIQICSTSEVYGQVDPKNVPIKETCPLQPINPYASSKLAQDNLGYVYHKSFDLNVIVTRMFTYLNPRRADLFATAFALQIVKIEKGELNVLKHGNLNSIRTLIDVRDGMEAYWQALTLGQTGKIYNIGGTTQMSVGSFLEALKARAKCPIKSEVNPLLLRPVDVTLQIPDCTEFIKDTDWKPKYSFEETMDFFLNEIRNNYK